MTPTRTLPRGSDPPLPVPSTPHHAGARRDTDKSCAPVQVSPSRSAGPATQLELPTAASICELVYGDPSHERERAAVVSAIRSAVTVDGLVNPNHVRPLIPAWVNPRVVSATYNALITRKILRPTGSWVDSTDAKGRNTGKPQKVYRWLGDVA